MRKPFQKKQERESASYMFHVLRGDPTPVDLNEALAPLATEVPEFAKIDLEIVAERAGAGTVVVDTRNLLDPDLVREAGLEYEGVGRR